MKKIKADWADHLLAIIIVMVLWVTCKVIIEAAEAHAEYEAANQVEVKGWQPRKIPQCDKELWLRIKDGCDGS